MLKHLFILILFWSAISSGSINFQNNFHPNIIIITTHDLGYGDVGITGNLHVQTPVINKFVYEDPFEYLANVINGDFQVKLYNSYSLENNIRASEILDAARQSSMNGKTAYFK